MKRSSAQHSIKALHIVESFGGGVFSFLSDLITTMDPSVQHIVAYAERPETPTNFKKYFPKNTKFIKSTYLKRNINALNELKAIKEIKQIIAQEKPDVVHLHSSKAGVIGRIACLGNKGIKVYYSPHGFSFLMQNTSRLKRKTYYLIEKLMALFPGTIIACSKGEYREAKKLTKKCINIDNGININKINSEIKDFKPHKANLKNPTICTIGRIDYQKNPVLFNEIAKQNPNLKFIWIGDGELKNELTAKNITITGWLDRKDVLKTLNNSDIFILTSLWEGLPISLLEAMYLKKLCIVSDTIGSRDVIINDQNGYIAKNASAFTNRIQNSTTNDIDRLTKKAYQDIIDNYNISIISTKYKKVYEL